MNLVLLSSQCSLRYLIRPKKRVFFRIERLYVCFSPAEFAVGVLEAGSQNAANIGHVKEHERNSHEGVKDGEQFSSVRLRGEVSVS